MMTKNNIWKYTELTNMSNNEKPEIDKNPGNGSSAGVSSSSGSHKHKHSSSRSGSDNSAATSVQAAATSFAEAVSGTAWVQTGESGTPLIGTPGSGSCGTLSSGMLESSNVDITNELVNLMTAQRNYQANTKVISTSTQLDQALFQAM